MTTELSENQPNEEQIQISKPKNLFLVNKRFKHYVFEFTLVFMAVFFGFLAETYRENLADRYKEKAYIISLVKNLEDDVNQLSNVIALNEEKISYLDTVQQLRARVTDTPEFYQALNMAVGQGIYKANFFKSNAAVLTEMKTSGLTLLPRDVIDSLAIYERNLYQIQKEEVQYEHHGFVTVEFFLTLTEDWRHFNSTMTADKKELKRLFNSCVNVSAAVRHYNSLLNSQKINTARLINYLRDKYDIELE